MPISSDTVAAWASIDEAKLLLGRLDRLLPEFSFLLHDLPPRILHVDLIPAGTALYEKPTLIVRASDDFERALSALRTLDFFLHGASPTDDVCANAETLASFVS